MLSWGSLHAHACYIHSVIYWMNESHSFIAPSCFFPFLFSLGLQILQLLIMILGVTVTVNLGTSFFLFIIVCQINPIFHKFVVTHIFGHSLTLNMFTHITVYLWRHGEFWSLAKEHQFTVTQSCMILTCPNFIYIILVALLTVVSFWRSRQQWV